MAAAPRAADALAMCVPIASSLFLQLFLRRNLPEDVLIVIFISLGGSPPR